MVERPLEDLCAEARARRDRRWGRRLTYSPKVFLPLTNLCPDRCAYCSFRKSPGDEGAWTMRPDEVIDWIERGRARGCTEALFCLGDKPERAWASYRAELESFGHASTVEYLEWACREAIARGLMPHTNAGLLDAGELARLKPLNASLGLMLESASDRLCLRGGPHFGAPDKKPSLRIACIEEAGRQRIPFTTGILVGIGETLEERIEALRAILALHKKYGHIQEVIVQPFRRRGGIAMADAPEPTDDEIAQAIALARIILDDEVAVQTPPNLNPDVLPRLIAAGINDFGGISPVTRDYISPGHAWPEITMLTELCAREGFSLEPRLPVYDRFRAFA